MKSFLKDLKGFGQKSEPKGMLIGKTINVGPYTIKPEAVLGEGGFATIYKVRDTSGAVYALKHMHLMGDRDAIADCQTEVDTLKRLREVPTVLTLRALAYAGVKGQEQEAFLLLDMCQDNLVNYLNKRDSQLPDSQVITIFHAICQAVAAMHHNDPPLAHRDLKAENVLLHQQGHWLLCDFGSTSTFAGVYESTNAIMAAEEIIRKYTTPAYRAPEMYDLYMRERIDTKADIWAMGCLLYYLAYGKLAFVGEAKLQVLNGDFSIPPRPQRPQAMKELIRFMLTVHSAERPDIDTVLSRLGSLATNLNVDTAPTAGPPLPSVSRPVAPTPSPQNPQGAQPVSSNPQDLLSRPGSASEHVLPARRASSGNLKVGREGSRVPPRSSSPAMGMAPLSPQHAHQTGSGASGRLSQGTTSTAFGERSQGRPPQQSDSRPTSPIHPSPSPLSSSGDGNELRQLVAGLQSQNSQLIHVNKQQQSTIAKLERELQQLRAAANSGQHLQQSTSSPLVSLDSWSQASPDTGTWDAFSNQPQGIPEPSWVLHPTPQAVPSRAAPRPSPLSPLSPQRQAAAAQAQAFIKSQNSNVQSMQELLPAFDPFGISNQADAEPQNIESLPEHLVGDDMDEPSTPLSGAKQSQSKHKLAGRHRRTTSEPTPMDSWQLRSEWPQH